MKYVIVGTRLSEETLFTTVSFTFENDATAEIEIPHFMPRSVEDVLVAIENRMETERSRLAASAVCVALAADLDKKLRVEVPVSVKDGQVKADASVLHATAEDAEVPRVR